MRPTPPGPHALAASRLTVRLAHALPAGLEVIGTSWDWVLRRRPLLVRQPDVVVVTAEQALAARLTEPPLLAVEILTRRPGSATW